MEAMDRRLIFYGDLREGMSLHARCTLKSLGFKKKNINSMYNTGKRSQSETFLMMR